MGQRHQIYVITQKGLIGLHHQWLYGQTALLLLKNYLRVRSDIQYSVDEHELLQMAYSFAPEQKYYHGTYKLKKSEALKPLSHDNNNGITIIDMRVPNAPKYCFMSIHHLECLDDTVDENLVPNFIPLSADKWIRLHYANYKDRKLDKYPRIMSRKTQGAVLCTTVDEYKKHVTFIPKNIKQEFEDAAEENKVFRKFTRSLVDELSQYAVLTVEEIQEFFPQLFLKQTKETA